MSAASQPTLETARRVQDQADIVGLIDPTQTELGETLDPRHLELAKMQGVVHMALGILVPPGARDLHLHLHREVGQQFGIRSLSVHRTG